jgi:hypothetical protein
MKIKMYIDESALQYLKLMLEEKVKVLTEEIADQYVHVEIEIEDSHDLSNLFYAGACWGVNRKKLIDNYSI